MHSQCLSRNISLSMVIIMLIHAPSSSPANEYRDCGRLFECGDITGIGYPFWGSNYRPVYCGHPNFQLNCTDDVVEITISSLNYRVHEINSSAHTLTAVRTDYWNNVCPKTQIAFHETNLDFNLFNYTSDTRGLRLYYGCSDSLVSSTQFNCSESEPESNTISYFAVENYYYVVRSVNLPSEVCKANVMICIFESQATVLKSLSNVSKGNLIKAINSGFGLSWYSDNNLCDECDRSGGRCGYNLTSGGFACFHYQVDHGSSSKRNLVIGISSGLLGLLIIFVVILGILKIKWVSSKSIIFWKKTKTGEFNVEAFIKNYTSFSPKRYSYSNVKKMTNTFEKVIGKGGYGCVYKGMLPNGRIVAVKLLKESKSNGEEFINEVASMGRTSHVNIVTLLGFCYEGSKRALIYDYMPNGSLDKFIFNQESSNMIMRRCLEWNTMYEISLGIARGLEYLHNGCNTRILHFDIKPQNILLDKDFCPKISDFGLAKLWLKKESVVSMIRARGTAGYIAPEVLSRNFGGVSHKSDVYSYGMLVLELVGWRKNIDVRVSHTSEIYFPSWIYEKVELGKDLRILGVSTEEENETARKMVLVSFWCIQTNPSDRPPMSKVIDMLEGNLKHIQIPPKPFLFSPVRSP